MSTKTKTFYSLPALMLACCFAVGCGDVRAPVSGKVTFQDGSPLTLGEVRGYDGEDSFIRGWIEKDGTFELYEMKPGDGVPAGKTYGITVTNAIEAVGQGQHAQAGGGAPPRAGIEEVRHHVHLRFGQAEGSGLELVVPKSAAPIEFNITVEKPNDPSTGW